MYINVNLNDNFAVCRKQNVNVFERDISSLFWQFNLLLSNGFVQFII